MTPEELIEIEDREKKASAGPWHWYGEWTDRSLQGSDRTIARADWASTGWVGIDAWIDVSREEDEEFIANARTDIPKLIEEVKRLQRLFSEDPSYWYCDICGSKFNQRSRHEIWCDNHLYEGPLKEA